MFTEFNIRSRLRALETLTRSDPDFQPKGGFEFTLYGFQYKPEDCLYKYYAHADSPWPLQDIGLHMPVGAD